MGAATEVGESMVRRRMGVKCGNNRALTSLMYEYHIGGP